MTNIFLVLAPLEKLESQFSQELRTKLIVSIVILVTVFTVLILILIPYYLKKTSLQGEIPQPEQADNPLIQWERNYFYDSEESLAEVGEESYLPSWLRQKKKMIFSKDCISKGHSLGKGQFGMVYKGKLSQGNAV